MRKAEPRQLPMIRQKSEHMVFIRFRYASGSVRPGVEEKR